MNPLVSVIIPAYNAARYLPACLDSVLAQTFSHVEILLVDDGSQDDTVAVLAPYRQRIRYFGQANRGVYAARNRGIREARGQYIAFLDADDLWCPGKTQAQVDVLEQFPEYGAIHSDTSLIDSSGRILKIATHPNRQSINGRVFEEFFASNMAVILLSSVMIRKSCFEKTGLFDERYPVVQDYAFFLRLAWHYPIYFIRQPLVHYRVTPGSLSRRNAVENVSVRELLLREFIGEHGNYFQGHPHLLKRKWISFHYETGLLLFHTRHFKESRAHLRQALGAGLRAWLYWLAACLPPQVLEFIVRHQRAGGSSPVSRSSTTKSRFDQTGL